MEKILASIVSALLGYGPAGLAIIFGIAGWAVAGWLLYNNAKKKEIAALQVGEVHSKYNKKIEEINIKYNKDLAEINEKHVESLSVLSEKRIQDLKDITDDYHELAQSTLQALDRIVLQIQSGGRR